MSLTKDAERQALIARMAVIRELNPHCFEDLQSYRNAVAKLRRLDAEGK